MNLASCDTCGIVLDKDKLPRPQDVYIQFSNKTIDETKAAWTGEAWVPAHPCPVCREMIPL